MTTKIISIIGPESTGKSELAAGLAKHFDTMWVREFAREYLSLHGKAYSREDLLHIAKGQKDLIAEHLLQAECKAMPFLFLDTDLNVIRVWSEYVFNGCDNRLLHDLAPTSCDLYLLCNTDLPWAQDELREYPDLKQRRVLFDHYRELLTEQTAPWYIVSGTGASRLQNAVTAVEEMLI